MRLHTTTITATDVYAAVRDLPGVYAEVTTHGSRKRDHALEVKLTGTSSRRPNSGNGGAGDDYAATWDEWGVMFQRLFDLDDTMTCYAYDDRADYMWKTDWRFVDFDIAGQHRNHRWEFAGVPREHVCATCDAVRRF